MSLLESLRAPRQPVILPHWPRRLLVAGLLVVLVLAPLYAAPYQNFDRSMVLVYVIVGLGLNMLTGNTGQLSLGHGAFFATGAYGTAIAINQNGWHYLLALPACFVLCFCLGYLLGRPALRFRGLQLALVTLAIALVTPAIIKRLDAYTLGHSGIVLDTARPPDWIALDRDQWVYYLALACAVVAFVVTRRVCSGRTGRALTSIRDYETVAETFGIRSSVVKTRIFALSAGYAGVAGALYVFVVQYVGPEAFGLNLAIAFITLIVVGGLGAPAGAVFGAVFIQFAPAVTSSIDPSAAGMIYGGALMLCVFVLPHGVLGLVRLVHGVLAKALETREVSEVSP